MFTLDKARQIFPDTLTADAVPAITARFKLLSAEDQLALIWFAYLEMGQTITVAAPGAARRLPQRLSRSCFSESKWRYSLATRAIGRGGRIPPSAALQGRRRRSRRHQ